MPTLIAIADAWRWNLPGLICGAAILAVYGLLGGFRPSRSLLWFLAGESVFIGVVCSPLDALAHEYLFTAEALERIAISQIATYLLVLGIREKVVRCLRLDRVHISYYFAWIAGMAVLSVWNVPRLLGAALSNESVRGLEFATLLAGGAAFWWPIHSPVREQRMRMLPTSLLYLAAAMVWCSLVGLYLAFEQPWDVMLYSTPPDTLHIADSLLRDWSLSRELDQETAGLLFWIGSATVLLTEVMIVYYRWYISPEERKRR